jgi:hypothetical protein
MWWRIQFRRRTGPGTWSAPALRTTVNRRAGSSPNLVAVNLPRLLVGIFDPAGRYMRKHDRAHPLRQRRKTSLMSSRHRPFVGGAVFGPDVPGGARQATAEELASMRERAQQHQARHEFALESVRSRWGEQALVCARDLLGSGTTVLSVDGGQVRGHLVRFWRGDNVLELSSSSHDTGSGSMTRLSRGRNTSAEAIAHYLIHEVARMQDRPS